MSDENKINPKADHTEIPVEGRSPSSPPEVQNAPLASAETPSGTEQKADLGKRAIALIIDSVIAAAVGMIPAIGGLIGAAYMLLRDGFHYDFMDSRSVGKKIMKLRPVKLDGSAMTLQDSAKRNWPLVLGSLSQILLVIPVIGWVLIPFVLIAAVILSLVEIIFVLTNDEGKRLGDRVANTKLIEVEA